MRHRPHARVIAALVIAALGSTAFGQDSASLKVPFRYASLGIGRGAEMTTIVLDRGKEAEWVSRQLLLAIQDLQFSVKEIRDVTTASLRPRRKYTTDRVSLDPMRVEEHNRAFATLSLPRDFLYAVEHEFSFDIVSREIVTVSKAHLFYKTRLAREWKPYDEKKGQYSGQFFSQQLLGGFERRMKPAP